jgi:hypothetical protein
MPGCEACELKLALQIGQGHIDIAHRHARTGVAEQFHHGRKSHAGAKHFRSVGVPHLVGDDIGGKGDGVADHVQVLAKPRKETGFSSRPGQQPSIGGQRIERAEEAQTVNEIADEGIDGDHAFGLELAEGNMDRSLFRSCGSQAVIRQIDAFADTHAGVAEQQEDISAEIVAAEQLLL